MMAVSFERYGRLYYLDPGPLTPTVGDKVLVPTDAGPEVAESSGPRSGWMTTWTGCRCAPGSPPTTTCPGTRPTGPARRGPGGRPAAGPRARPADEGHRRGLRRRPNVFTIYFSAPGRVDFRALVRDLAARLRGRVELRQIGPRDEARLQGGIGPCGRDLCCATFLKDFEPVSVRMAKDQDLPVNPLRIAGACGRLMCCLKYEHPLYQDFRKDAPGIGETVDTPEGPGVVTGHSVPGDKVVVKLTAGRPEVRLPARPASADRGRPTRRSTATRPPRPPRSSGAAVAFPIRRSAGARWRWPARYAPSSWRPAAPAAPPAPGRRASASAAAPARSASAPIAGPCRAAADHAGRLLRAEAALAALRQGVPVRAAARPVRLPAARVAAVLAAGDPAARHRPGTPDRLAGGQPRRSRRIRGQYALQARSAIAAAVRARFDVVGFDPRGVGGSEPAVHCLTGPQLDTYFATNDNLGSAGQLGPVVRREQAVRAGLRAASPARCCRYVGHAQRGPGHGRAARRARRRRS